MWYVCYTCVSKHHLGDSRILPSLCPPSAQLLMVDFSVAVQDAAQWCCRTCYVDVNARDNAGFSPLHESCAAGQLTVAKMLLAYGADVNLASRLDGVRSV